MDASRLVPLLALALPALLALALPGCTTCAQLAEQAAGVTLGTGSSAFEALAEGDTLQPDWGPQGGQHVYGSARLQGLHEGAPAGPTGQAAEASPELSWTLGDSDGLVGDWGPYQRHAPGGEVVGLELQLWLSAYDHPWLYPEDYRPDANVDWEVHQAANQAAAEELMSRDLQMSLTVVDRCDRSASDQRTVRIAGLEIF